MSGAGGEDSALEADRDLLVAHGHEVLQFFGSNAEFGSARGTQRLMIGARAVWSRQSFEALDASLRSARPDVAHIHNTFGQLSGSIYWALARHGVPVVQTLHNYRWICPNALLLREGRPCEQCVGRTQYPALLHRCRYNDSVAAAIVIAASNTAHSVIGTYKHKVHAIIALTAFMKSKLIASGFNDAQVHVRANFLPDTPGEYLPYQSRSAQMIFVGLVDEHKGVALGVGAWQHASLPDWRLLVVGEGPLRAPLAAQYREEASIEWAGRLGRIATLDAIGASRFAVLPSLCYEGLPMVLLEAMSRGTPAIVPDHGAFPEIVEDGVSGLVFRAGDMSSLAGAVRRAASMSPPAWLRMARAANERFVDRYSAGPAYDALLAVYASALFRAGPAHR